MASPGAWHSHRESRGNALRWFDYAPEPESTALNMHAACIVTENMLKRSRPNMRTSRFFAYTKFKLRTIISCAHTIRYWFIPTGQLLRACFASASAYSNSISDDIVLWLGMIDCVVYALLYSAKCADAILKYSLRDGELLVGILAVWLDLENQEQTVERPHRFWLCRQLNKLKSNAWWRRSRIGDMRRPAHWYDDSDDLSMMKCGAAMECVRCRKACYFENFLV